MRDPFHRTSMKLAARLAAALGVCFAIVAVPQGAGAEVPPSCGGEMQTATVVDAADAATLILAGGHELHLVSIIAPGTLDNDRDAEAEARALLRRLAAGKTVKFFATAGAKDRYGRTPVRGVLLDELTWLEAALVDAGAVRVAADGEENCLTALRAREEQARTGKRGLWARDGFRVYAATDIAGLAAATGRFAVVEGRVRRTGEFRGRIFLDFGRRYVEDFSIVVTPEIRKAFTAKGEDPKNWRGRRIRVRGVLGSWGGPAIELSSATAIEMLDTSQP